MQMKVLGLFGQAGQVGSDEVLKAVACVNCE